MQFWMGHLNRFSIDYIMFKTLLLSWCPELKAYNITAVLCQLHWLPIKQKDLDTNEGKVTWLKMNDQIVEI